MRFWNNIKYASNRDLAILLVRQQFEFGFLSGKRCYFLISEWNMNKIKENWLDSWHDQRRFFRNSIYKREERYK